MQRSWIHPNVAVWEKQTLNKPGTRFRSSSVFIHQETVMGFFQNPILHIVIAIAIPFIAAWGIGYSAQRNMYPWYKTIKRPTWGPPDWIFGPMWTFLYASMGYASFRVWSEGSGFSGAARIPLIFYIIQLMLNATWTWVICFASCEIFSLFVFVFSQVFFGYHLLGLALIHILVLLAFIITTGLSFYRIDRLAGWLFVPYVAWVSFASFLTFTIWRLNPW